MARRKAKLKKAEELPQEQKKSRFQIIKLEERIAPHHRAGHDHGGGGGGGGNCRRCCRCGR